jgi:hypothetical protein
MIWVVEEPPHLPKQNHGNSPVIILVVLGIHQYNVLLYPVGL